MQLSQDRNIQLRFSIDQKAPQEYRKRWDDVNLIIGRYCNERIQLLDFWKSQMKLSSNKSLPILDRSEGGLGGNNNQTDKQVRFADYTY